VPVTFIYTGLVDILIYIIISIITVYRYIHYTGTSWQWQCLKPTAHRKIFLHIYKYIACAYHRKIRETPHLWSDPKAPIIQGPARPITYIYMPHKSGTCTVPTAWLSNLQPASSDVDIPAGQHSLSRAEKRLVFG
jgi:hypothetical protein